MLSQSFNYVLNHQVEFLESLGRHLELSGLALLTALLIALPLAIWSSYSQRVAYYGIGLVNVLKGVPSLVILVIFLPWLGLGFLPAFLALTLLAIPPILLGAYTGFVNVESDLVEAGLGLGLTEGDLFQRVKWPQAYPYFRNGLRIASIEVLASASLAAYIGGGGLGEYIVRGIGLYNLSLMLVGAIPVAFLALLVQVLFTGLKIKKAR